MKEYLIKSYYIGTVETKVQADSAGEALRIAREISITKDFKYMDYQNSVILDEKEM